MTPRAIRTQNGIAAYNALPNDASTEDRIGAAMDLAFEEGKREAFEVPTVAELEKCFSETAYLAPIVKPWAHEHAPGIRKAIVAWRFWRQDNIRALSSAPPPATAQPRSEEGNARVQGPEELRLGDRLFNNPNRKTLNFHFTPGPKATPEGVCREINKALDEIERGDCEPVDDIDGDLATIPSPKPEDALREALIALDSDPAVPAWVQTIARAALAKEGE